jgi:hypothetical protein
VSDSRQEIAQMRVTFKQLDTMLTMRRKRMRLMGQNPSSHGIDFRPDFTRTRGA